LTWFKVDDRLHANRKPRLAGPEAMGLWVLAASWVADNLNEGFIPRAQCFGWVQNVDELASRLVAAGLWEPAEHLGEDGWRYHDWDVFQPSRSDVETRREYDREKKRRQRLSRGDSPGTSPGSPGTGIAPSSKENPYPDSRGESRGDNRPAHLYEDDGTATCRHCHLPQTNALHRVLFIVDAAGL